MNESERWEQILSDQAETLEWMQSLAARMSYLCTFIAAQVERANPQVDSEHPTSKHRIHFCNRANGKAAAQKP